MALSVDFVKALNSSDISFTARREDAIEKLQAIDRVQQPISYEEFFANYLLPNKPCILEKWATEGWRSRLHWGTDSEISWDVIEQTFGSAMAPVANCTEQHSYSQAKTDMTVNDFVSYIRKTKCNEERSDLLYLKDWHFTRHFPNYEAYRTPLYFLSDWLNEFWDTRIDDHNDDDYRFVYIGPKSSWTPFHADVLMSYSWSANIYGRKRWILFAPGYEQHLRDKLGRLPFDLDHVQSTDAMDKRFEVIQESGEIIFVPSGWHHQVYNIEDTISINHNWLNGCNVDICWNYLQKQLCAIEDEIAEHRQMEDWKKHCQLILRADSGMDFSDFYHLLYVIASNRLKQLQEVMCKIQETDNEPALFNHSQVQASPCQIPTRNISEDSCISLNQRKSASEEKSSPTPGEDYRSEIDISSVPTTEGEQIVIKDTTNIPDGDNSNLNALGCGHALFDLRQIEHLLKSDFLSEGFVSSCRDDWCSPKDLVSRINNVIAMF